ncbi:hypothetical protein M011DRAFT_465239 [Sporormia fimetaria CBS 119925]|uniref:Secreted protein n=1 Tax=Sporormia fimetaria CBS 119925 TaxID=1340428 RepID=A0A6A6VMQ8_9PLEO|nr:hypothetical protein M011DRAFT_465239 [Sporormia fimetaria CBS 119925]
MKIILCLSVIDFALVQLTGSISSANQHTAHLQLSVNCQPSVPNPPYARNNGLCTANRNPAATSLRTPSSIVSCGRVCGRFSVEVSLGSPKLHAACAFSFIGRGIRDF